MTHRYSRVCRTTQPIHPPNIEHCKTELVSDIIARYKCPLGVNDAGSKIVGKDRNRKLSSKIGRKMLSGKNVTVAQVLLARDAVVPRHSHVNEQFTYILSGALKFTFDDQESVVVHGGEVLFIPSNVPHSAVALGRYPGPRYFCAPPRRLDQ